MTTHTYFITGTDTDAGKTWVTTECLKALVASGIKAIGMKPVASGCEMTSEGLRNDDALKLIAASSAPLDYALINPISLREPTAPEIAAKHDGLDISLTPIFRAYEQVRKQSDLVLIEGVGGWMAPLSDTLEQADLVNEIRCPVILVVGLKLGCINHARLTQSAMKQDGVHCAGWIVADVDPNLLFPEEYFDALRRCMHTPYLGRVSANAPARLDGFLAMCGVV